LTRQWRARRGDDLCAVFHALCRVMIFLMSRLAPADQREIVRTLPGPAHCGRCHR
jgi:hypothetical protein